MHANAARASAVHARARAAMPGLEVVAATWSRTARTDVSPLIAQYLKADRKNADGEPGCSHSPGIQDKRRVGRWA